MRFKVGNQIIEKYRPHQIGTVTKINEGKNILYQVRMKNGSIRMTTGESFVRFKKEGGDTNGRNYQKN